MLCYPAILNVILSLKKSWYFLRDSLRCSANNTKWNQLLIIGHFHLILIWNVWENSWFLAKNVNVHHKNISSEFKLWILTLTSLFYSSFLLKTKFYKLTLNSSWGCYNLPSPKTSFLLKRAWTHRHVTQCNLCWLGSTQQQTTKCQDKISSLFPQISHWKRKILSLFVNVTISISSPLMCERLW